MAKGAGGKVKSSSTSGFGVSGGKGRMFGKSGANPMQPGQTAASGGDSGGKFAKGGSTKMFTGTPKTVPAKSGTTRSR
jgi:hypothetical protein